MEAAKKNERNEHKQRYLMSRMKKRAAEDPFNVEAWHQALDHHTFKTRVFEMTIDEANAVIADYRRKYMRQAKAGAEASALTPEHQQSLEAAAKRLDEAIKTVDSGAGCFVRLSTRSPKDATLASPEKVAQLMADALSSRHQAKFHAATSTAFFAGLPAEALYDPATTLTLNEKLQCLFEIFSESLRVRTGQEAISLFVESERTYMDLMLLMDAIEGSKISSSDTPGVELNMNWIVREWCNIPIGMEFRGFVHHGVLTALTQYDNLVYYEPVALNHGTIATTIQNFYHDEIRPRLAQLSSIYDCCVVDFALFPQSSDTTKFDVKVVELNPYNNYEGAGTGGSLFNWTADAEVLEGCKPFQFRFLKEPPPLEGRVYPDWMEIIEAGERVLLSRQAPRRKSPAQESSNSSGCTTM